MKKKNILITIVMLMVLFIGKVRALEEPFKLDWKKENLVENFEGMFIGNAKFQYKDGYVTLYSKTSENDFIYYVNYYKKDGTLVTSKKFDNFIVINATTDNEYIYILVRGYNKYGITLVKLDSSLKAVKTYNFSYNEANMIENIIEANKVGMSTMSVINNTINIVGEDILQIDTDLKSSKYIKQSESIMKKYFEKIYYLEKFSSEDNIQYITLDKNDKYYVYSGIKSCNIQEKSVNFSSILNQLEKIISSCQDESVLSLRDSNNKVIWNKKFAENEAIIDVKLVGNYVVGIKMTYEYPSYPENEVVTRIAEEEPSNIYTEIVIYDLKGNLVQTIDNDSLYLQLVPVDDGFMVNSNIENKKICVSRQKENNILELNPIDNCAIDTSLEVYTISYNIISKISGNGHIYVAEASRAGSSETFKIVADKGWKVASIKITDEQGNAIEYKENTFIMPSSDITIEVTFEVENPNTSDIWISGITIITIILGIILIKNKKKLKFLK